MMGKTIGSYQILAELGRGGMGEVYRARDRKLNRDVAIKVLLPSVAGDPDRLARFRREAQVLASLSGAEPRIGSLRIEDFSANSLNPAMRVTLAPDGERLTYSTRNSSSHLWLTDGLGAVVVR